jgi:hypothetical protein
MSSNRTVRVLTIGVVAALLVAGSVGGLGSAQETTEETTASDEETNVSDEETTASDEVPVENRTQIRVVHVSPFVPATDVSVDNEPIATNVSFLEASPYVPVEAGDRDFQISLNETGEEIFESNATVQPNTSHTVAIVGTVTDEQTIDFQPVLLDDDFVVPDENNASVRLVHTAPDVGAVDVTVAETGATVADNVSFRDDGTYVTVPAGNATLEVREETPDNDGDVIGTFEVSLDGGTVYSAYAVGYQDAEAAPVDFPLDLVLVTDAGGQAEEPTEEPTENETTATPGVEDGTATPTGEEVTPAPEEEEPTTPAPEEGTATTP